MFVKKLSISILALYEMFYKGLRRGTLIFYANTFNLFHREQIVTVHLAEKHLLCCYAGK